MRNVSQVLGKPAIRQLTAAIAAGVELTTLVAALEPQDYVFGSGTVNPLLGG
jgi:hypothetical protein